MERWATKPKLAGHREEVRMPDPGIKAKARADVAEVVDRGTARHGPVKDNIGAIGAEDRIA